ncbi:MAG: PAS domain-containing sensor histidine kinase [Hyphomicrobiales bacterium]|nr:PAS domain-containing sensor histidine kinase [Hyphomicrobiales bacterium]
MLTRVASGASRLRSPKIAAPDEWTFPAGLVIVILSLISGFATYGILSGLTPITPTDSVVITVFLINGVLILALMAIVGFQLADLLRARKRQAAGAGLHVRILSLFALVAIIPAIILATFATVSLDRVLEGLFSTRVKSIVQNSLDVATSYVQDHEQIISSDLIGMGEQIENSMKLMSENPEKFQKFLAGQATLRKISAVYIINDKGDRLAVAGEPEKYPLAKLPEQVFSQAAEGKVVIFRKEGTGNVGAIKKLSGAENAYMSIIRPVRLEVIRHLQRTQANAAIYKRLDETNQTMKLVFIVMYATITFTLLLAAVWFGLWFTKWLVAPIRKLIGAAQQVSEGNLDVHVDALAKQGDVGQLGATFNRMTADLRKQRAELVNANEELEERRRFIETVLSGVSAGVLGLDTDGRITLANKSAVALLGVEEGELVGRHLQDAVPEFGALLAKSQRQGKKPLQQNVSVIREGSERNYAVRVTREIEDKKDYGVVLTFDDVSELVVAQRTSAWADVARRIAHEIKNPLTPIQLSAERIRRKYGDSITQDREIFDRCTDTIIRHVGDIGRMVDEFSSFARMPTPVIEDHDVAELVKEAVILFQMSHSEISYTLDLPEQPMIVQCDRRLITQAVTNLVKNAGEAIAAAQASAGPDEARAGRIIVKVRADRGRAVIEVTDNGCGLPKENRHRLIEPYVTTRQKGTGLGLAIVQRITEQHGGALELEDAVQPDGSAHGAVVRLSFPILKAAEAAPASPQQKGKAGSPAKRRADRAKHGATYGV